MSHLIKGFLEGFLDGLGNSWFVYLGLPLKIEGTLL